MVTSLNKLWVAERKNAEFFLVPVPGTNVTLYRLCTYVTATNRNNRICYDNQSPTSNQIKEITN